MHAALHGGSGLFILISMFKNFETANRISDLMLDISGQLGSSVAIVSDGENCTPDEVRAYKLCVARILDKIHEQVLGPLFAEYPRLRPPELDEQAP